MRDGSRVAFLPPRHTSDGSTRTDFFFLCDRKYTHSHHWKERGEGISLYWLARANGRHAMEFPSFDLTGQVALVTGAARGLGGAISLALAHAGADVALGLRDVKADSGLAAEIRAMGRRALPLQMDMTKLEEVQWAVAETAREFGRLDILVNNAGLGPENPAEKVREEDFDLTVAVNLKGTFFASQAAGRVMIRQGSGKII